MRADWRISAGLDLSESGFVDFGNAPIEQIRRELQALMRGNDGEQSRRVDFEQAAPGNRLHRQFFPISGQRARAGHRDFDQPEPARDDRQLAEHPVNRVVQKYRKAGVQRKIRLLQRKGKQYPAHPSS